MVALRVSRVLCHCASSGVLGLLLREDLEVHVAVCSRYQVLLASLENLVMILLLRFWLPGSSTNGIRRKATGTALETLAIGIVVSNAASSFRILAKKVLITSALLDIVSHIEFLNLLAAIDRRRRLLLIGEIDFRSHFRIHYLALI